MDGELMVEERALNIFFLAYFSIMKEREKKNIEKIYVICFNIVKIFKWIKIQQKLALKDI